MPKSLIRPGTKMTPVERQIRRIVNARSVTFGLGLTFVALALVGGILMRVVDQENFPTVGLGIWFALNTVTTVGYGDVVPTTLAGRAIAGLVMAFGIAFISFVTAGVTSTLVQRAAKVAHEADLAKQEQTEQRLVNELGELGKRLDAIDSKLAG
jgi:voltage-gated potassium channel